ncbi:MAG: hypothetical protein EPN22_05285 [Nitrospirae bacterium]|nr:MAG: hypothetical protein EPN22_05285 [Nitrospirota bacterium]
MRRPDRFLLYLGANLAIMAAMFAHSFVSTQNPEQVFAKKIELVKRYGLTDLCIFTEARYTRHPSQADLNTPFQDYPLSFEHFPSGSIIAPPGHLRSGMTHE